VPLYATPFSVLLYCPEIFGQSPIFFHWISPNILDVQHKYQQLPLALFRGFVHMLSGLAKKKEAGMGITQVYCVSDCSLLAVPLTKRQIRIAPTIPQSWKDS
jgi:hypothetical protein